MSPAPDEPPPLEVAALEPPLLAVLLASLALVALVALEEARLDALPDAVLAERLVAELLPVVVCRQVGHPFVSVDTGPVEVGWKQPAAARSEAACS